jgi:hypothetical protein
VDEFMPTNDIGDGKADGDLRYGRWSGHPEDRVPVARLYANPSGPVPVVVPTFTRDYPDAGDNWKIGTRLTHNFGELSTGVGYIWGYNPQGGDMVFKTKGTGCSPRDVRLPDWRRIFFLPLSVPVRSMTDSYICAHHYPIGEPLEFRSNRPSGVSSLSSVNLTTLANFRRLCARAF